MQTVSSNAQSGQARVLPIRKGDRVRSIHAARTGTAVKVYRDGSAAVCWDDGDPQPKGLAHERMPRNLLEALEPAAPSPDVQSGRFPPSSLISFIDCPALASVIVVSRHENTSLSEFATMRAQQLEELMLLAGDCGDTYRAVLTTLTEEIGREVSSLLRAIARGEVQHV